ncbi:MAG: hypothetical protein ABIG69_18520 [Bacteroidota bacterium]
MKTVTDVNKYMETRKQGPHPPKVNARLTVLVDRMELLAPKKEDLWDFAIDRTPPCISRLFSARRYDFFGDPNHPFMTRCGPGPCFRTLPRRSVSIEALAGVREPGQVTIGDLAKLDDGQLSEYPIGTIRMVLSVLALDPRRSRTVPFREDIRMDYPKSTAKAYPPHSQDGGHPFFPTSIMPPIPAISLDNLGELNVNQIIILRSTMPNLDLSALSEEKRNAVLTYEAEARSKVPPQPPLPKPKEE